MTPPRWSECPRTYCQTYKAAALRLTRELLESRTSELSAANERLNAMVPEVEEQVRMAIVSFRLGDREAPVEVVPVDLARDRGRRLAEAHATIDAAGAYEFRENILRGIMTDALERAEAAESARDEAVAKERDRILAAIQKRVRTTTDPRYCNILMLDETEAAIRGSSEGGGNG